MKDGTRLAIFSRRFLFGPICTWSFVASEGLQGQQHYSRHGLFLFL